MLLVGNRQTLLFVLCICTFTHMSKPMKTINLQKLATNFAQEKSAEERYWQRNDAKFRAVHQRCANYDEFRQIVQAAHLRPLDRNETLTLQRQPTAWNQPAANQSTSEVSSVPSPLPETPSMTIVQPKNHTEFLQQWRRIPNELKFDYLHQLDHLESLFQLDVPSDFVDELSQLFHAESSFDDAKLLVKILSELPKSKRFELMKSFWSSSTRLHLDRLFSRLCSFADLRPCVFLLRNMYL